MNNYAAMLVHKMRKILQGLGHVKNYIDNLIVYIKNWDTHLKVLDELLHQLQQAHLAVWPMKCLSGLKSVKFLGHLVGGNCFTINRENLEKICKAKHPTTKKEI